MNNNIVVFEWINRLNDITSQCTEALQEENYTLLNDLLNKRDSLLKKILDSLKKSDLINSLDEKKRREIQNLMKKITKDSEILVDHINRRKKGVVKELKQLQAGKKSLMHLKDKVKHKKVISKLI